MVIRVYLHSFSIPAGFPAPSNSTSGEAALKPTITRERVSYSEIKHRRRTDTENPVLDGKQSSAVVFPAYVTPILDLKSQARWIFCNEVTNRGAVQNPGQKTVLQLLNPIIQCLA